MKEMTRFDFIIEYVKDERIIPNNVKKIKDNFLDFSNMKIKKIENIPNSIEELDFSHNNITKIENLPTKLKSLNITN